VTVYTVIYCQKSAVNYPCDKVSGVEYTTNRLTKTFFMMC